MALIFFEKLSNNYIELLNDEEDFNIVINVGESPDIKYNIKTLNLNNISIQQFEIIIKYIYGGIVLLEKHDASFIFELMLIAYELLFDELGKQLQTHLIVKGAHWLRLHFIRIYQKSSQDNKLQDLQNWCNDIVVKYPNKIFDSEEFFTLQENALVSLISRDDLQM
ncbi:hypothetical protein C2G38_2162557 [Gigaspora rosea]|uniref:BACK domain-containing protein n=1 Tax=Gigaspora rosea TaxID=44941 RepID=A0A397VVW5_9GLOM|nr:hypothetical protein C2G38_2162557 [Gigaspora rosea]